MKLASEQSIKSARKKGAEGLQIGVIWGLQIKATSWITYRKIPIISLLKTTPLEN